MKMSFKEHLKQEIFLDFGNKYKDNYDFYRFGQSVLARNQKFGLKKSLFEFLSRKNFVKLEKAFQLFDKVEEFESNFSYLYENLYNKASRDLLVKIAAFRILGHEKVKLPLNTPSYWKELNDIQKLKVKGEQIIPNFKHFILDKFDLTSKGYPIQLFFSDFGVYADFFIKQYEYVDKEITIKAEKGDVVIDAGGCWGDTALYFANEIGRDGKVYSFEFIPKNLDIFQKNIQLNPQISLSVEIIPQPLWAQSRLNFYYIDKGPASKIFFEKKSEASGKVESISIDDFISQRGLKKLDFIKMDIEGAEYEVLQGANRTIKQYSPKLAISLYHSIQDFNRIPKLIKSINPDYKLFLSHATIHAEETVLFAIIES